MTTVLFIHGTGVRQYGFAQTRATIAAGLAKEIGARPPAARPRSDVRVAGCYWGGIGAELRADGDSFYFDQTGKDRTGQAAGDPSDPAVEPVSDEEQELARWARLADDPLYEIRFRELDPPPSEEVGEPVKDRILALPGTPAVASELADDAGLSRAFAYAVRAVTDSDDFNDFFGDVYATDATNERMLARAVVAACLAIEADRGVIRSGERRDRLVAAVRRGFGAAPDYGLTEVTDRLGVLAKNTALNRGLPLLNRGLPLLEPAWRHGRRWFIGQFADILYYQAHGSGIRRAVRDRILEVHEPVVLLAHSLGGIIAFDLLTEGAKDPALEHVKLLVTVGSQVPLFYELDVLAKLRYRRTPRAGFPPWRWVNVYDKRDMLAYVGEKLFPGRCADIEVDTGAPFWPAHNAYWDTARFYAELADAMYESGL